MATIKLAGRELDVKPATMGFLKHGLLPWKKRLAAAATEEDTVDLMIEGVKLYVGHNEGVTDEWLLDALPADVGPVVQACAAAAGQAASARAGEAARQ